MTEAEIMENYRVHERVGSLEQKVHTLEHRANSIEWIKPEVTKQATLISEMLANHKALKESVQHLGDDFDELNEKLGKLIAVHQDYRTSQMQELQDIRSSQIERFTGIEGSQDKLRIQIGMLVKTIVFVGLLLGILVNLGKISELINADSNTQAVQAAHVPCNHHCPQRLL